VKQSTGGNTSGNNKLAATKTVVAIDKSGNTATTSGADRSDGCVSNNIRACDSVRLVFRVKWKRGPIIKQLKVT